MTKFRGIFTPLITPFTEQGDFYPRGMENLVNFLADAGIHGVFAVGSYGQFPMMTVAERKVVAETVIAAAKPRGLRVVVQIGAPGRREALELACHAADAGADAVASVVPFYYSGVGYDDATILDHYAAIKQAVSVPVHFYNNPKTTGFTLRPRLLAQLIDIGVSGIKDSGAELVNFGEMMNVVQDKMPEFDLMPGSAAVLLAGMILGARACVAGTSAAFPELVVSCYDALQKGDIARAAELQLRILRARSIQGAYGLRAPACYDLLAMRGIDVGGPRLPWRRLTAEQKQDAQRRIADAALMG